MARKLLSMDAIRFIIECRNDPSQVYTWQDIADLVKTKFDIKVSGQAVGQGYKKYQNVVTEMNSTNPKPVLEKVLKTETQPIKTFDFTRKIAEKPKSTGFDDSIPTNEEMQEFLKPQRR